MKPLDLTKPIQTVDGREARIICTDRKSEVGLNIVALIKSDFNELTAAYNENGINTSLNNDWQLINTTIKRRGWINIYTYKLNESEDWRISALCSNIFLTKEIADNYAQDRAACIEIEWEETE